MTPEEKELQEKLQIERDKNIELKFQNLDEKMDKMIALLEQNSNKYDETSIRLTQVEEKQRNCCVGTLKREMHRIRNETSAVRSFGKSPRGYWGTHIAVTFGLLVAFFLLLAAIGTEGIIKILTFL